MSQRHERRSTGKVQVESMAEALQGFSKSDVLFLQEVQGENLRRQLEAARVSRPAALRHHQRASSFYSSYGKNAAIFAERHPRQCHFEPSAD